MPLPGKFTVIGGKLLAPPMVTAWNARLKPAQALGALGCGCIFAMGAFVLASAVLGGLLALGGLGALIAFVLTFTSMFVGLNIGISVGVRLLTGKAGPDSTS
jgi:hypothetical protein